MTIGEKIKYFRTQRGLTQGKLAELSEIHPVSIRKYETNKMQPQPAQFEKIAAALNISKTALSGINNNEFRLETVGDLMGLLMILYNSGIIQVKGKRNDVGSVSEDTCEIKFNPILPTFIELFSNDKTNVLQDVIIAIKDPKILSDFLSWDKVSYCYTKAVLSATEDDIPVIEELLSHKNAIELELQSSIKPL